MSIQLPLVWLFVIAVVLYVVALGVYKLVSRDPRLPPGPKGVPLLGNIDMPGEYQWLYYWRLKKQYGPYSFTALISGNSLLDCVCTGDLVAFVIFGKPMMVVNSRRLAYEMTVKRSDLYSDRPHFYSFDLSGWIRGTALLNGPGWRDHRRNFSRLIGTRLLMSKFFPIEIMEARKFMRNILRDPDNLDHHVRQYVLR